MLRAILSALGIYNLYQRWLSSQIDLNNIPKHVGVILDGNRRWANNKDMNTWEGHREGAEKVKKFLEWCFDLKITTVTLYGFSTENFKRPKKEVAELMRIYEKNLSELLNSEVIHENNVRVSAIGRINLLPENVIKLIKEVESVTKNYKRFFLNIAMAYGGRAEIVDASKKIAIRAKNGEIDPNNIDEELFEKHLYTSYLPQQEIDFVIRTSGETRLSNFLLWQSAYSELFIVDVYWPDFRRLDLERVIRSFQNRQRKFGK
jgi:tritrans,polycis-undecaprenyl-diphosphate synthase [geranylgeranyl-diphosphate specific]